MTESVSKVRVLACAENKFSKGLATQSEIRRPAAWRLARNAESQAHHTYWVPIGILTQPPGDL